MAGRKRRKIELPQEVACVIYSSHSLSLSLLTIRQLMRHTRLFILLRLSQKIKRRQRLRTAGKKGGGGRRDDDDGEEEEEEEASRRERASEVNLARHSGSNSFSLFSETNAHAKTCLTK